MPTVPQYNRQVVEQSITPSVRVSTDAPAGAFISGEPLMKATQAFGEYLIREKNNADKLRVEAAQVEFAKKNEQRLYGPDGLMSKKGQAAFGQTEEYLKKLDEDYQQQRSTLSNDQQRGEFDRVYQQQRSAFQTYGTKHEFNERDAFDQETTKSALDLTKREIVMNAHDSKIVDAGLSKQIEQLTAHAERTGKSKEWIDSNIKQITEDTTTEAFMSLIESKKVGLASQFLKQRQEQLGLNYGKAKKALDYAIKDNEDNIAIGAANIIERGGTYDDIPQNVIERLPLGARTGLRNYSDTLRGTGKVETDPQTYYNLRLMAADPKTKEQFTNMNLMTYRDRLDDSTFKELVGLQTNGRKGQSDSYDKMLEGFRTKNQIATQMLESVGIDSRKDIEKATMFYNQLESKMVEKQKELKRPLTNEETVLLSKSLLIKGATKEGFLGFGKGEKRAFELGAGEKFKTSLDEINTAKADLRRLGLPETPKNINAAIQRLRIKDGI